MNPAPEETVGKSVLDDVQYFHPRHTSPITCLEAQAQLRGGQKVTLRYDFEEAVDGDMIADCRKWLETLIARGVPRPISIVIISTHQGNVYHLEVTMDP